jgi:hypothetical protein
MTYISGDVESGLEKVAEEKQRMEFEELERKKNDAKEKGEDEEDHGMSGHFFMAMVGNGMGVFQIITSELDTTRNLFVFSK